MVHVFMACRQVPFILLVTFYYFNAKITLLLLTLLDIRASIQRLELSTVGAAVLTNHLCRLCFYLWLSVYTGHPLLFLQDGCIVGPPLT